VPPEDVRDWVALHLLELAPSHHAAALARWPDAGEIAWRVPADALAGLARRDAGRAEARIRRARVDLPRRVDRVLARCRRDRIGIVPLPDAGFPELLREIADPPVLLYVRGALRAALARVAVVGSRRASAYGRRVAGDLSAGLSDRGVQIVSGGARGIDACAHRGALDGPGGTVAVLGSGLDRPYPPEHDRLFAEIADRGAVVTEFPFDAEPLPGRFPRRNRIIAGLSAAVVVVEAADRSGSLVTARLAADEGREVLAVPGPITSDRSEGCHRLIQSGAKLVRGIEDVLEELTGVAVSDGGETPAPGPASEGVAATEDERAVLAALDPVEPVHLDRLAERVPFGVARLQAALFALELRGAVDPLPGRYYCWPPRKER